MLLFSSVNVEVFLTSMDPLTSSPQWSRHFMAVSITKFKQLCWPQFSCGKNCKDMTPVVCLKRASLA